MARFKTDSRFFLSLALISLLAGCASSEKVAPDTADKVLNQGLGETKEAHVALLSSLGYLPQVKFDEQGQLIPYQAKDNPYLLQKLKVGKGSVLLFLEAKDAWRNGDAETAKQKLEVIVEKDNTISGPLMILGDIAMAAKDYPAAEKYYQQGLKINPGNVNGYTALAQVERILGEYKQAQNTLVQALALWPDFPEAHYNISILFDVYLNQPEKAVKHLEAFIFLDGGEEEDELWLEQLKERLLVKEG